MTTLKSRSNRGSSMTTSSEQKEVARANVKKAQATWRGMTHRQDALAQPQGRARKRPGAGGGRFYRIEIRPKSEFVTFRTQDVGKQGHLERLAGKRSSGSWDTQAWLVAKEDAHIENEKLIIDNPKVKEVLQYQVPGAIVHVKGDIFRGHIRHNVPESEKPTPAQQKAWKENIKKAQKVRQNR